MNRQLLFVFLLLLAANVYPHEKYDFDLSNFYVQEITQKDYTQKDNWKEVIKNDSKLYLYYKVDSLDGLKYISEFLYILQYVTNDFKILGGYTKQYGFIDSHGNSFTKRKGVDSGSDFMKESLQGISMELLEYPFIVSGIAIDSDGEVYETEVLEMFSIDSCMMTIEEWYFR